MSLPAAFRPLPTVAACPSNTNRCPGRVHARDRWTRSAIDAWGLRRFGTNAAKPRPRNDDENPGGAGHDWLQRHAIQLAAIVHKFRTYDEPRLCPAGFHSYSQRSARLVAI